MKDYGSWEKPKFVQQALDPVNEYGYLCYQISRLRGF
jgi:hypothetical protein